MYGYRLMVLIFICSCSSTAARSTAVVEPAATPVRYDQTFWHVRVLTMAYVGSYVVDPWKSHTTIIGGQEAISETTNALGGELWKSENGSKIHRLLSRPGAKAIRLDVCGAPSAILIPFPASSKIPGPGAAFSIHSSCEDCPCDATCVDCLNPKSKLVNDDNRFQEVPIGTVIRPWDTQ